MTSRVGASIAAVALLVGCSTTGDEPPKETDPATTEAAEDATSDAPIAADSGVGVRDAGQADVLAEASFTMPGTEDEVPVGVLPLEVEGAVMTLRLAFTPDFASLSDGETVSVYEMYPDNLMKFRPTLVDRVNLKEYSLISETGQDWAAQPSSLSTVNGEPVVWWGVYAAPEDDINSFDLRLRDALPEFTEVPVP